VIGTAIKKLLKLDVSDNSTAANLAAAFPDKFPDASKVPKFLFTCLPNLVLSGIEVDSDDEDAPQFTNLDDFISVIYGDADQAVEAGILIKEQIHDPVIAPPQDDGSHIDERGLRLSYISIETRFAPPKTEEVRSVVFDEDQPLAEQVDLRIQWLIEKSAREQRRFMNSDRTLSGFLDPSLDITLDREYPFYLLYLKTPVVHALDTISYYRSEYKKIFL